MARCEDYPCCGHEPGDCPRETESGKLIYTCSQKCGRELTKRYRVPGSSICKMCMRQLQRRWSLGYDDMGD
jgi:hypothetical protein